VVTVQQPQKRAREDEVNAKMRQPTFIQDRTYVGAICTEKIHYFCRYVRVRAYAKKGKCDCWGRGGHRAIIWGTQKRQHESRQGWSNCCLKSNRQILFGPEEAPENPPLLSVSHAIEINCARFFLSLDKIQWGAHNPREPKTSTVATSANGNDVILGSTVPK
jgi:hypothetical protein